MPPRIAAEIRRLDVERARVAAISERIVALETEKQACMEAYDRHCRNLVCNMAENLGLHHLPPAALAAALLSVAELARAPGIFGASRIVAEPHRPKPRQRNATLARGQSRVRVGIGRNVAERRRAILADAGMHWHGAQGWWEGVTDAEGLRRLRAEFDCSAHARIEVIQDGSAEPLSRDESRPHASASHDGPAGVPTLAETSPRECTADAAGNEPKPNSMMASAMTASATEPFALPGISSPLLGCTSTSCDTSEPLVTVSAANTGRQARRLKGKVLMHSVVVDRRLVTSAELLRALEGAGLRESKRRSGWRDVVDADRLAMLKQRFPGLVEDAREFFVSEARARQILSRPLAQPHSDRLPRLGPATESARDADAAAGWPEDAGDAAVARSAEPADGAARSPVDSGDWGIGATAPGAASLEAVTSLLER